jgi:hypothetical protein
MSVATDPQARIALSRERLRVALRDVASPSHASVGPHRRPDAPDWLGSLKDLLGSGLLSEVLQNWWMKQPLQVAIQLASQAVRLLLQPLVQRHPYRLVVIAAGVGAVVMLVRPWRWISVAALLAGCLPKILPNGFKYPSTSQPSPGSAPSKKP